MRYEIDRYRVKNDVEKNNFIRAYNVFIDKNSNFKLNPKEFYVYCIIFIHSRDYRDIIKTSVDMVDAYMGNKFNKQQSVNKKIVRESIQSLIEKRVFIPITNNKDDYEHSKLIKNNTQLYMDINNQGLSNSLELDGKSKNFTSMKFSMFYRFKDICLDLGDSKFINFLYIYFIISRDKTNRKISYSDLSKLTGLGETTIVRYIDEMVMLKILSKESGRHIDDSKYQEANTYSVNLV